MADAPLEFPNADDERLARSDLRGLDDAISDALLRTLRRTLESIDVAAARRRVEELRRRHPEADRAQLVQLLIRNAIRNTAAIGAASSSASLVPGLGTLAATTLGVTADVTATVRLQAELVLAIAAAYDLELEPAEERRAVLLVTGLSSGSDLLLRRLGRETAVRLGRRIARRSLVRLLPALGIAASAGGNAVGTYLIGRQAERYFRARA